MYTHLFSQSVCPQNAMLRSIRIFGPVLRKLTERCSKVTTNGPFSSFNRRHLLTAATLNPPPLSLNSRKRERSAVRIPELVKAALSWASTNHKSSDPPTHALIILGRDLIPRAKQELLSLLRQVDQLNNLDSIIGVTDRVGKDGNGVSVLLASGKEGVTIETVRGEETEVLRVGKWHAKDEEDNDSGAPFDFDNILASIRKGAQLTASNGTGKEVIGNEFVFALGEAEGLQKQAIAINQHYPTADVAGITLTKTPTINSLFTTLLRNGNFIPASDMMLFRIPRSTDEEYLPPTLKHNLSWLITEHIPTITSYSGNLILELDNQPAMPYMLSLLPQPASEKERLNPPPLVARLHSGSQPLGKLCVNVLGGSSSRGGIALDPLVATGRLANDMKIEFAQLRKPRNEVIRYQSGVHLRLETLAESERRGGAEQVLREEQKLEMNVFSGGSEGGFFVGERGVVPWLCQIRGSRLLQQLTPHKAGERRVPIINRLIPPAQRQSIPQKFSAQKQFGAGSKTFPRSQKSQNPAHQTKPRQSHPSQHLSNALKSSSETTQGHRGNHIPRVVEDKLVSAAYAGPWNNRGDRKYGFRSRAAWSPFRPSGFKRSDHTPGGHKLDRVTRPRRSLDTAADPSPNITAKGGNGLSARPLRWKRDGVIRDRENLAGPTVEVNAAQNGGERGDEQA